MAKRNLTVQLDQGVIRKARVLAAERGTSVSALVAQELERLVAMAERYHEARQRAEEIMAEAKPRGRRSWVREDLYAERLDRRAR